MRVTAVEDGLRRLEFDAQTAGSGIRTGHTRAGRRLRRLWPLRRRVWLALSNRADKGRHAALRVGRRRRAERAEGTPLRPGFKNRSLLVVAAADNDAVVAGASLLDVNRLIADDDLALQRK